MTHLVSGIVGLIWIRLYWWTKTGKSLHSCSVTWKADTN